MSRKTRARSFLFEPARFVNDEAVRMMDPAALGGYASLFCHLWEQPEPGVVPADDRLLASLARMTPDEWRCHATAIARAFDTATRPGCWLQKGLIETAKAQDRFASQQSKRGKLGANVRWPKASDGASITNEVPCKRDGPSVLGSRFSGSEKIESTPERPRAKKPRASLHPVLTISPEQRRAAVRKYALDPADVESIAERIEAEAAAGKYLSAPGALHTWCRNEVRFAAERVAKNGNDPAAHPTEQTRCMLCGYSPLEQAESKKIGLCGSCQSNQGALNAIRA